MSRLTSEKIAQLRKWRDAPQPEWQQLLDLAEVAERIDRQACLDRIVRSPISLIVPRRICDLADDALDDLRAALGGPL